MLQSVDTPTPGTSNTGSTVQSKVFEYTKLGDIYEVQVRNQSNALVAYTFNYTTTQQNQTVPERLGHPYSLKDPINDVVWYGYDSQWRLQSATDAANNQTTYLYNQKDQITEVDYPSVGGTAHAKTKIAYQWVGGPAISMTDFDESGNQVSSRGITPSNEGAPTALAGNMVPAQLGLDALFRPTGLSDGNETTSSMYDAVGNLTSTSDNAGNTFGRFYDADGNLTTTVNARAQQTTYSLSPSNSAVMGISYPGDSARNVIYARDAFDRVTGIQDETGTTTFSYDDLDDVTSTTSTYNIPGGGGQVTGTVSYLYYPDGSRKSMITPLGTYSYNYL